MTHVVTIQSEGGPRVRPSHVTVSSDPYCDAHIEELWASRSSVPARQSDIASGSGSSAMPITPVTSDKRVRFEASPVRVIKELEAVPLPLLPVVMPGRSDVWEVRGSAIIRHHWTLGQNVLNPLSVRDIPKDVSELQPLRKTLAMDERQRVINVRIDEWTGPTGRLQREAWIGESRFYLKEQEGSAFEALKQEDTQADILGSDEVSGTPLPVPPEMSGSLVPEDFSDFWGAAR